MKMNIEHNNKTPLTKITVFIRGGVCIDVKTTLPDHRWEYSIIDYDNHPELPDDHFLC